MEKTVKAESRIIMIPVCRITCGSPTTRGYSRRELRSLSKSIEKNGIIQPITVRDITPYRFELISGERRLRAAVMLGISRVPCIVLHCTERQSAVYRLVENIQREPPGLFEKAEALAVLIDEFGFTSEQAAIQLGISQKSVKTYLSLLGFSQSEREIIRGADIPLETLETIVSRQDKTTRSEMLIDAQRKTLISSPVRRLIVKDLRLFSNTIERAVATMRMSGINAALDKREDDTAVEYRIIVRK